jgi:hypothetical protein
MNVWEERLHIISGQFVYYYFYKDFEENVTIGTKKL